MGKSRTVDEMAKYELVIPMVLRPEDSTGKVLYSGDRDCCLRNSDQLFSQGIPLLI
jgi:hypothetical protein